MSTTRPEGTIESSDTVHAIWTESGPAVFPSLELLEETRDAGGLAGHVTEYGEADREYYDRLDEQGAWREVDPRG